MCRSVGRNLPLRMAIVVPITMSPGKQNLSCLSHACYPGHVHGVHHAFFFTLYQYIISAGLLLLCNSMLYAY